MSEKKIDLEAEFKRHVADKVKERKNSPVNIHPIAVSNEGVCLYCSVVVKREDKFCLNCGKEIDAMSFLARKVNHDVKYPELENPDENFIITRLSNGKIIKEKGLFEG